MNETNLTGNYTQEIGQGASTAAGWFFDMLEKISLYVKDKIEYIGVNFPDYLYSILTVFIAVLFIYIGTRISNKIAKWLLWILGVILIAGLIYSVVS